MNSASICSDIFAANTESVKMKPINEKASQRLPIMSMSMSKSTDAITNTPSPAIYTQRWKTISTDADSIPTLIKAKYWRANTPSADRRAPSIPAASPQVNKGWTMRTNRCGLFSNIDYRNWICVGTGNECQNGDSNNALNP